ncbi:helix-turn-helix transcriptional regulator [Klenkia brasiliensis]|uniref:Helix-turn-helix domain-containing protein n=1 Tax=Klenkia brasiliensis TaxID=333142 RepID=A0A1G7SGL0_9ACTN|nr:helix-turn-helix transcriptional regulator [Klenkia brasiliensis]SDG22205.1 Helix-turn-helix domain-containing protein [Klenkia brasiliensis]
MHQPVRSRLTTDDPARAAEHLALAHPGHRLRPGSAGGPAGFAYERTEACGVRLDRLRLGAPARWTAAPTGSLLVVRVEAGQVLSTTQGAARRLAAGDVWLLAHPDAGAVTELSGDVALSLVPLDPAVLHQLDAPAGTADLRLTALPAPGAHRWVRTVEHARSLLDPTGDGGPGPLVLDACRRLLAATALELLAPGRAPAAGPGGAGPWPTPLQRAVAHIDASADLETTLDDIAAAAGVSARALQLAFRRHLRTTPLGHLRRVRLGRAHRDLLAADPSLDTVARVAGRWGFTDAGRFARAYQEVYGQPPSRTLHS